MDLYLKESFLRKIKGGKQKYKRYLGTTLRYAGGKSLAVGDIIEHIPDDVDTIVSPFIGGGSLEVALSKELGIKVIGYDLFDLLVNFWNFQIHHPQELYEKLSQLKPTLDEYERVKNILKQHWNKIDGYDGLIDPLDLAAYYYYNMQLSYGPGFLGWMSKLYENPRKYKTTIEKVRDFKDPNLEVFCEGFETSMPKHQNDFMYLDPPYYLDGDSKMFKGIYPMRNFPIHHNGFDHQKLCDLLHKHKGGFILSYNDCSFVRENYNDCKIIDIHWQYTMGQGETRIGKNRLERAYDNNNIKTSHELLIIGDKK